MHAEASGGFGEQRATSRVRVKDARPDEDLHSESSLSTGEGDAGEERPGESRLAVLPVC